MKFKTKIIAAIFLGLLVVSLTSCDIADALKNYPVNIPYSVEFTATGSNNSISESQTFCIDSSDTFQEYKDKIKDIKFTEISFRTISYIPENLQGDVTITLKDGNGVILFTESITGVKASDYVTTPYKITLTADEIQAINQYLQAVLETQSQICFTGSFSIDITSGEGNHTIKAALDLVFEAGTEL
ncbi:hypothetical protein BMS3Abin04_02033 [bacterium BMS3Abin04]|nr:hypothetical protein BMS3Abin04_02033 [bacterium BMS3Abin04]